MPAVSPNHKAIEEYHRELEQFRVLHAGYEQATRAAFEHLLRAFQSLPGWTLLLEQPLANGKRPDGTFRDAFMLPRGYWEAKDTADDLDAEITKKLQAGYPTTNTIFEDTRRAVLYQSGRRIDQYQVSTDPRSGITSDPNRRDDPRYIAGLIRRVLTVSVETVRLVERLACDVTLPIPKEAAVAAIEAAP